MIQKDKFQHAGICFLVSLTTVLAMRLSGGTLLSSALAGLMTSMAIGVGKEYGDMKAIGNRWDWQDIAADAIGGAIGVACAALIND